MTSTPYGPELNRLAGLWSAQPKSTCFAPLAEALRKRGALEQATAVAAAGIAARPDYLPGRLVMARIYRDQGERESAEAELRAALALDGTHPVVLEELGAAVGDFRDPRSATAETLAPVPSSGSTPGAVRVRVAPSPEAAIDFGDELSDDEAALPESEPVLTESLAMLYHGQGHLEHAAAVMDALVARAPENLDLAARRDAVRAELDIARPRPYDASRSGGRPVREWLSSFAAAKAMAMPAASGFDAFYEPAGSPPTEAGDLAAFQAWLSELDR